MPLPPLTLDTRRWADLVEEGRALLPRYSRRWTDHNVHDPGITLLELFAWLVELAIFRADRVPPRHRRKFLQLIGYPPAPPRAARTLLSARLGAGAGSVVTVPAGVRFADAGATGATLTTTSAAVLCDALPVAAQTFDGARFRDQSRALGDGTAIAPFGDDPGTGESPDPALAPALYLGFDRALPAGVALAPYLVVQPPAQARGEPERGERERIVAEWERRLERCSCAPNEPRPCPPPAADEWCRALELLDDEAAATGSRPGGPTAAALPPHHAVRTAWDFYGAAGWRTLDAALGEVADETRGLTLDGPVRLRLPAAMQAVVVGEVTQPRYWLRCRLEAGPFDATPLVRAIVWNAIEAAQSAGAFRELAVAPGVVPQGGALVAGTRTRMAFDFDPRGTVTSIRIRDADADCPELLVIAYSAAGPAAPGALTVDAVRVAVGTGQPGQIAALPLPAGASVADGRVQLWTMGPDGCRAWEQRPDLDPADDDDRRFVVDAARGHVAFGDGDRGAVPPPGVSVVARYATTLGAAANRPARGEWVVLDDALTVAALGAPAAPLAAALARVTNATPLAGGSDVEDLDNAAGRAVEVLWAHERLLALCAQERCSSLDQADGDAVRAVRAPERASTLLDYERIALDVPGARVRRARAWSGLDPAYPCLEAPGTVTVVVLPELPARRPTPSAGLRDAVRRHLDPRRVVGTRLVVAAPGYVDVVVRAAVRASPGADAARVRQSVIDAVDAFLHPLRGGPGGRGWPFGRDVFRSELLELIDDVAGVECVLALSLTADGADPQCANVCVPPLSLVASGRHEIEVRP